MQPDLALYQALTRRTFLGQIAGGVGAAAFASMRGMTPATNRTTASNLGPHFPPRAKRVIYLFQSGGPSQLDLFDYKPIYRQLHGS